MAREKKPVHKVVMTEDKKEIIQKLLQEYEIHDTNDIQEALKDLLVGTIKDMMEAEMESILVIQNLKDQILMMPETAIKQSRLIPDAEKMDHPS